MLSKDQQKIIEESLWIVDAVLKRQGFTDDEDLRQDTVLYMCKCLERYDETRGVKWSTYAYKSLYLYSMRVRYKREQREAFLVKDDLQSAAKIIAKNNAESENGRVLYAHICASCDELCRAVLNLKLQGFTGAEIRELLNLPAAKYKALIREIKKIAETCKNMC